QLDGPFIAAQPAEHVSGNAGDEVGMADAVFGVPDDAGVLIGLYDIRLDLAVPLDLVEGHLAARRARRHGPRGAVLAHELPPPRFTTDCTALRSARIRTFCANSTVTSLSFTSRMTPYNPPRVTTLSPFLSRASISRRRFCCA